MRPFVLSVLALAVLLLFSLTTFAQHGGGGGASAGGGGGSHGGGSSSGSGGGHSSGGSVSHGSSSGSARGSSVHTSAPHISNGSYLHTGVQKSGPPEKHGVFHTLFHAPKKHEPQGVIILKHRLCPNGKCAVCPASGAHWGCRSATTNACAQRDVWNGGSCLYQSRFLDDCSSLLQAMQRQQQLAQAAEATRQGTCASAASSQCSEASNAALAQSRLYQSYADRYRLCRGRRLSAQPFGAYRLSFSSQSMFDPLWAALQ